MTRMNRLEVEMRRLAVQPEKNRRGDRHGQWGPPIHLAKHIRFSAAMGGIAKYSQLSFWQKAIYYINSSKTRSVVCTIDLIIESVFGYVLETGRDKLLVSRNV